MTSNNVEMFDFFNSELYLGSQPSQTRSSIELTVRIGEGFTMTASLDELVKSGIPDKYIQQAVDEFKLECEKVAAWALPCPHCGKKRFDPVEK